MLFATGIDPERSIVFAQSHVTAHAEANWLLSAVTSFELRRMTQFKDKFGRRPGVRLGRAFTYPVLMAGDILLYQTDIVPIGDDQRQHLELTRDVAERFNARYGETFTVPKGVYPEEVRGSRTCRSRNGLASTSAGNAQGVVRIDEPDVIRKKFKTAVTDSSARSATIRRRRQVSRISSRSSPSRPERRSRRSNALRRLSATASSRRTWAKPYGALRADPGAYRDLRADEQALRGLLAEEQARARASRPTLDAMYERMGFVRLS